MNLAEWPGQPEPAASPDSAALGPVPWEDPERPRLRGIFKPWWRSCAGRLFFAHPARGGPAEPCAFGLITGTTGSLLGLFWWLTLLIAAGPGPKSALAMAQMADLGWRQRRR